MDRPQPSWLRRVSLPPPSLKDNTADVDRLFAALKEQMDARSVRVDLDLLKALPRRLREARFSVQCVLFEDRAEWVLIEVLAPDDDAPLAGFAVDLGTTRMALRLIDLGTSRVLAEGSVQNPQAAVGPDILTRVHFAEQPGGLCSLNRSMIDALNGEIEKLCLARRIPPERIVTLSAAGNTAMTHLFLGLNPYGLIREPYIPVVNRPAPLRAAELGICIHPRARAFVFPNVGSYFGGDLVAGILYSGLHREAETAILMDVGTNAEVVLGNAHLLVACAGAAGPALEGGVTRIGMTAGPGVIDQVHTDPDTGDFEIHTIDNLPPRGICGSGLIDLAAGLFTAGMIDIRGKLVPSECGDRYAEREGMGELTVVPGRGSETGRALAITAPGVLGEIDAIRDRITHLELNVNPEFMNRFNAARFIPHTDARRFPSVKKKPR